MNVVIREVIYMSKVFVTVIVVGCIVGACETIRHHLPTQEPAVSFDAQKDIKIWSDALYSGNVVEMANDLLRAEGDHLVFTSADQIWASEKMASIHKRVTQSSVSPSFLAFIDEPKDRRILNELLKTPDPSREDAIAFKRVLQEVASSILQVGPIYTETKLDLDGLIYKSLVLQLAQYPSVYKIGQTPLETAFLTSTDANNARIIKIFIDDFRAFSDRDSEFKDIFRGTHVEDYLAAARIIASTDLFYEYIVINPTFEKLKAAMKSMSKLL